MTLRSSRSLRRLALGAALLAAAGCGGQGEGELHAHRGAAAPAGDPLAADPARWPARSSDPRVVAARAALDEGRLDLARGLVEQAQGAAGFEGPLLRARLAFLAGDELGARRALEEARRGAPGDPRVSATAAELAAAAGHLEEADELLRAGLREAGGALPELLRARGVTLICTPGLARSGLELLERAVAADPELPFVGRALGQAHLIAAKELLHAGDRDGALAAVERSLEHDPAEVEARRLRAEVLLALGEWGRAIGEYRTLIDEGQPLEVEAATYAKNAGFWAMAQGERELALSYYRLALEWGLPRAELGTGESVLIEAAADLAERAADTLAAGDSDAALGLVEEALELDPESLLTWFTKGCVHKERDEPELVVAAWQRVIASARAQGLDLPQPVHILLAEVQGVALGRFDDARRTLEGYLLLEPHGAWIDDTRALLEKLPGEPAEVPPAGGDR